MTDKDNPRFVVISYDTARMAATLLYEELYCARADIKNRITAGSISLSKR